MLNCISKLAITLAISCSVLADAGCVEPKSRVSNTNSTAPNTNSAATNANTAAPAAGSEIARKPENAWAVTLPVLDAFLADDAFGAELKSKLELTDQQVNRLRAISREATTKLRDAGRENKDDYARASELREKTERDIADAIGQDRVTRLLALVADRWNGNDVASGGAATAPGSPSPAGTAALGVPSDTRIVVNSPAFRMDIFENGQLIKSYKIGIGYPEFPLPTGLRKADTIIFNPTWTPPDEPWVEAPGSKVEVGKLVKAGDKLNPLGVLKIPIGLPSLIHGGKSPSKIGNFASHGCVGLTNLQAEGFAKLLARLGGAGLTDDQIAQYEAKKTETETVKLTKTVPVELRYQTITVEDGKLHIYRDVYDRDTNTEGNLRDVLQAYGVTLDQLSKKELALVMTGLEQMSRDASGRPSAPDRAVDNSNSTPAGSPKNDSKMLSNKKPDTNSGGKVTRAIKGQKEVVIPIPALEGKGYPSPVDQDTGANVKSRKTLGVSKQKPRK